eukprot:scaffold8165_cov116-Isochrysis_galbana.AAC.8
MAPRQLLLELAEVDMAAEKGPKRVRVDIAEVNSTQQKTPSGVAAPPITTTAKAVHYNPSRGLGSQHVVAAGTSKGIVPKTYNLIRIEPPNTMY